MIKELNKLAGENKMIKELIKLANHLDSKGLAKESDYLDGIIKKSSEDSDKPNPNEIRERWIGEISQNQDIIELCDILAEEAIKEGMHEKFGINKTISSLFESKQQDIIIALEKLMEDREIEDPGPIMTEQLVDNSYQNLGLTNRMDDEKIEDEDIDGPSIH
jgi:hypothetical protein